MDVQSVPLYGLGNGGRLSPTMFFDPHKRAYIQRGGMLPHWWQPGVLTYITFRLGDSLPQSKLHELLTLKLEWMKKHPEPWTFDEQLAYMNEFGNKLDYWLDQGYGDCILANPSARRIVVDALRFHDGDRYALYDYVVMPNHVHLIILPYRSPDEILHSIKSFTANRINKLLGRTGLLWQKECFDRLLRSLQDYQQKADYIRHNPDVLPINLR